jgi:hypothetical protein
MDETDLIIEYSRRFQFARFCQYLAAPMLLVSLSCLWISRGAFATSGEKLFLILSGLLFIASLALALLSVYRYRCPSCSKNLGVARKIAFCPYCGVNLQPSDSFNWSPPSREPVENRGIFRWIESKVFSRRGSSKVESQRTAQGAFHPEASYFPEETYPKNIRLFTTSDEIELTRRYFRLIAKDENPQPEGVPENIWEDSPLTGRHEMPGTPGDLPRWRNRAGKK